MDGPFRIDFSSDDDDLFAPPKNNLDPNRLPPLTLAMGAKNSVRIEDVQKKDRTDSSRFSIPIIGSLNPMQVGYLSRSTSSDSSTQNELEEFDNDRDMFFTTAQDATFGYQFGSLREVSKPEIPLVAPNRGSSFSSNTDSLRDVLDGGGLLDIGSQPTLASLTSEEPPDPFAVPPSTPTEYVMPSRGVDMEMLALKLSGIAPADVRDLRAFEVLEESVRKSRTPHATPHAAHEPRTFERLVQKVNKLATPRTPDIDVPFYDGIYMEDRADRADRADESDDENLVFIDQENEIDHVSVADRDNDGESEELLKYKRWFEQNHIDPNVINSPVLFVDTFMTPSPQGLGAPKFTARMTGGSAFSASSGATDNISRLGNTPSPMTPHQPNIGKMDDEEKLRLTLEIRSKTSALCQAVEEMGKLQLEMAKLQQQLNHVHGENTSLKGQVKDLVISRQRVLVSASKQFDICRRKLNPVFV